MLKKILIAVLFAPLVALAQSYPSPTYQNLTVLGTFTSSGSVSLPSLAAQAANTVVANFTASSASPTAFAMPSCSTSSSILQYTSGTGLTCSTVIWASPPAIGGTAANSGAFTTLSASSTVSGTGFSTYLASPPAIGGTAAAAGSFTNLSSSGTVSGTGFSTYLASPPAIGATTPSTGKFTSLTVTSGGVGITGGLTMSSGAITPVSTSGVTGTTTNDNAVAGAVGEFPSPTNLSAVSLSNNTPANCASISLTAGDWDVSGSVQFVANASTTIQALDASISTTSATQGAFGATNNFVLPFTTGSTNIIPSPVVRESLSSTTTVYLVANQAFGTSTMTCNGFIRARRVR